MVESCKVNRTRDIFLKKQLPSRPNYCKAGRSTCTELVVPAVSDNGKVQVQSRSNVPP